MSVELEQIVRADGWVQSVHCLTMCLSASSPDESHFTHAHYHEYIELLYGLDGVATVMVGDRLYDLASGDLMIINAKEPHDVICQHGTTRYHVIKFLPNLLYAQGQSLSGIRYLLPLWKKEIAFSPAIRATELEGSSIGPLVEEIVREWNNRSCGYELVIHANIMQIFVWMLRHRCPPAVQTCDLPENLQRALQLALEKTQEHLEDWTAQDAARACNLSYSYFSRNFKKAYGISFSAYLESMRLREGERLLLTTDMEITDIATAVGFGTTSYFIERFRRRYGVPPRIFRMRMRAS